MPIDDFWVYEDEFSGSSLPVLNLALLRELRNRPPKLDLDLESALSLSRIIYEDFLTYGTGGEPKMTEVGSREALRTLRSLLARLGKKDFEVPFSDFAGFRSYWLSKNARGNWQARRDLLRPIFEPVLEFLDNLQDSLLSQEYVTTLLPMPHDFQPSWVKVEEEISALKRNFSLAQTPQEYRNVGNDCVAVLTRIAEIVYTEEIHASYGGPMLSRDATKERLSRFVDARLNGSSNASIRGLVRRVIELAQDTKHDLDGTKLRTVLIADSVIMLASILKSVDQQRSSE